jgi:hypothetical protein
MNAAQGKTCFQKFLLRGVALFAATARTFSQWTPLEQSGGIFRDPEGCATQKWRFPPLDLSRRLVSPLVLFILICVHLADGQRWRFGRPGASKIKVY